eukprot:1351030-Pleurochrysis_carterae.AAC.8
MADNCGEVLGVDGAQNHIGCSGHKIESASLRRSARQLSLSRLIVVLSDFCNSSRGTLSTAD